MACTTFSRDSCPICYSTAYTKEIGAHRLCSKCGALWQYEGGLQNRDIWFEEQRGALPETRLPDFHRADSKIQATVKGCYRNEYALRYAEALRATGISAAPNRTYLEIGFGGCQALILAASETWGRCVGIEIDWRYVLFARERGIEAYYARVETGEGVPPNLLGAADVITASEVMEHMLNPALFLTGAIDLMKPDGKLWLSFAQRPGNPADVHSGEWQYWSVEAIEYLMHKVGLEIFNLRDCWLSYLVAAHRI